MDPELDAAVEDYHNYLLEQCNLLRERRPDAAAAMSLGETLEDLWERHLPRLRRKLRGSSEQQVSAQGAREGRRPKAGWGHRSPSGVVTPRSAAPTRLHPLSWSGTCAAPPPPQLALARRVFDWHMANLEFANASLLHRVSLAHWDQVC